MKIKQLLTNKRYKPRFISSASLVEPQQEMTIKEILENFSNGQPVPCKTYEAFYGEEYQDINLDVLDPVDRLAIEQEFTKRYYEAMKRKEEAKRWKESIKDDKSDETTSQKSV